MWRLELDWKSRLLELKMDIYIFLSKETIGLVQNLIKSTSYSSLYIYVMSWDWMEITNFDRHLKGGV